MNIYFGKISQKFDPIQIEKGYYKARKDSSWFGGVQPGDYVYLIGGSRIQFWQADYWEEDVDNDRLYFKILNKDLGIGVNDLISLNFFPLTIAFLVKTVRSTAMEKCAFFKLNMLESYTPQQLSDSSFYTDKDLYRKIQLVEEPNLNVNSKNVQLYVKDSKLHLYKATFIEDEVFNKFRDNWEFAGKGQPNKDKTILAIKNGAINLTTFDKSTLNLRNFYDAFCCDYKEKVTEEVAKEEENTEIKNMFLSEITNLLEQKKNLILQGAPGTGKTYCTAEISVAMCYGVEKIPATREKLMETYNGLVEEGRVMFTTFHQSIDYEEFIEGIKPDLDNSGDTIKYIVKPGLFKQICEKAKTPILVNNNLQIRNNPNIWKVSLLGTGENHVRQDCIHNNRIRIGWDQYGEIIEDDTNYKDGGKVVLDAFINKMQIGDIVMSCYSNRVVDAIGVIIGEYEWIDELSDYKRTRKVNWLIKNIKEDIYEMNKETVMTLSTVYRLNNISLEDVMSILKKHKATQTESIRKNTNPYILIIDEINRGNISKIFGELITLLEVDKRLGKTNQITVRLPYTPQEEFGVPSNLYIIGTMNTADRSLGYIDYAVRRRFAFKTLKSDKNVIESADSSIEVKDKSSKLFDIIYQFIDDYIENDLITDDLMLGHSYFLAKNTLDLRYKLEYEIIPLIREYEKDGIVNIDKKRLNENFMQWLEIL